MENDEARAMSFATKNKRREIQEMRGVISCRGLENATCQRFFSFSGRRGESVIHVQPETLQRGGILACRFSTVMLIQR